MNTLTHSNDKMTSLQLAEITGKQHSDVMKAIRKMQKSWVKLGQGKFSLSSYINEQNRAMPKYDLTKTETLYIATKFNDIARAKLVLRWQDLELEKLKPMSSLDMVQASINAIRANERELEEVKKDIAKLKAKTTTRPEYYTVAGYGNLNGISVNIKRASILGRSASRICRKRGLLTDTIPDPRFGIVNMYPKEVLEEVFKE